MAVRDFTSQRLFVDQALAAGESVALSSDQSHYLRAVLRMPDGAHLLVFNGREGEWAATLRHNGKRGATLDLETMTRPQAGGPDIVYAFAPLKRSRLDYMVQKATELGVAALQPILTQHTIAERLNLDRMRANVIEAAEQCGVLRIPELHPPLSFASWLDQSPVTRPIIYCDEAAPHANPIDALARISPGPSTVVVGPEGGFSAAERARLHSLGHVHAIALGPRIMRADTAAIAALALVNAVLGDWR
jgi:16S rRNA (uracil1498-N3)-methyltransferase